MWKKRSSKLGSAYLGIGKSKEEKMKKSEVISQHISTLLCGDSMDIRRYYHCPSSRGHYEMDSLTKVTQL
jgi:hypothetical protein